LLYCDSSAWLKRYIHEPGSSEIDGLFEGGQGVSCSMLGYVELIAALSRRFTAAEVTDLESRLQLDWQDMTRVPVTDTILLRAANVARDYRLRGADAVHLATAMEIREDLASSGERVVFVASDKELLAAAGANGFKVLDPAA